MTQPEIDALIKAVPTQEEITEAATTFPCGANGALDNLISTTQLAVILLRVLKKLS